MADGLGSPFAGNVDMSGGQRPVTAGMGSADLHHGHDYAAQAAGRVAQDPHFQSAAQEAATAAAGSALRASVTAVQAGATRAIQEVNKYIQMGPAGVSVLCIGGAIATSIVGILGMINFLNIFSSPMIYLLNFYLFLFGIAMLLIELDVERLSQLSVLGKLAPVIGRWQSWIFQEVHLISGLKGRGFFYLFVGLFCMSECWLCLTFIAGFLNTANGILCILSAYRSGPPTVVMSSGGP